MARNWLSGGAALLLLATSGITATSAQVVPASLRAQPERITLDSPESTDQLLVIGIAADGGTIDLTRAAEYSCAASGIADVAPAGVVTPIRDGSLKIRIDYGELSTTVQVDVQGQASPTPVSFEQDVIPILSKSGCNSGSCHGKAEGQNGLKLSVFGFDAEADHRALVLEGRGRRLFASAPNRSLLLQKATALIPHGGGRKIEPDSRRARLLQRWIREGASFNGPTGPAVTGIAVEPAEITLGDRTAQQLRVVALDSDGRARGVTVEADFQSNNDAIVGVDDRGLMTATDVPGEAAILVRYLGHVGICRVTHPRASGDFERPPERNFIDRFVWDKLQHLRVSPSPVVDDATFLRRVYLDTIGTLPTPDEARRFLEDRDPANRSRLAAELLQRPEYADYWAQRWSDLLRIDRDAISPQSAVAMSRWVRGQVADNKPYDQFVRSILTVQGPTLSESPAAFFQVHSDAEKSARAVSQLFLGVRIECAQCHHHPFERWDQQDYYALAGFFTGIDRRAYPLGGTKIVSVPGGDLQHPRTMQTVAAAGLGAPSAELAPGQDRRHAFADWVTSRENPFFARTIANRLWAHYLGRGLVEPIDDHRATNPASNELLLDALANHLIELQFDLRAFTLTVLDSQVYQLSSAANQTNRLDDQNYSRYPWKPLPAEVLLDAVSQATSVPEEFNGWPVGYRAIQVWDNKLPSHFLEVFGRPRRQTVCACERGTEPSIAQALHLMNAPEIMRKIEHGQGRAAQLAASDLTTDAVIDELFLAALSRFPNDDERRLMTQAFREAPDRRRAAEDILWTLLNTREFVFNH